MKKIYIKIIYYCFLLICICTIYDVKAGTGVDLSGRRPSYSVTGARETSDLRTKPEAISNNVIESSTYFDFETKSNITVETRQDKYNKNNRYIVYTSDTDPNYYVVRTQTLNVYQPKIDIPPNPDCYRLDKGNGEYEYKWAISSPGKRYVKVSKDECKNDNENLINPKLCKASNISGAINPTYTCKNSISTDSEINGQTCSIEEETFYEYKCTEKYIANYTPELENRKLSIYTDRFGLSNGFIYNINLSVVKICEGNFYDNIYNEAYTLAKNNLGKAKNAEEKAKYQDMIDTIQGYADTYNNKYAKFSETKNLENKDITGEIIIEYLKLNQKTTDNMSKASFPFDVTLLSRNVEKAKMDSSCANVKTSNEIIEIEKQKSDCVSACYNNIKNSITKCTSRCNGNRSCISNCTSNVTDCDAYCDKQYKVKDEKTKCSENNNQVVTLVDGKKVSPYTISVTENFVLTAPIAYVDDSGKVVKRVYSNENYENTEKYKDGGQKFYLDSIQAGGNYKITTKINNLGINKQSSITNENCPLEAVNTSELYRIIDVDNPFVNAARLDSLSNNWKNSKFDFTNITNEKKATLYSFNLSKNDIEEIKQDNTKDGSYLGLCDSKNESSSAINKVCEVINTK